MTFVSYAQNFEDVLLNRVLAGVEHGFYVDVGAYHPVSGSVTKAFYDRGWRGINIEPGPGIAELQAARPRDINLRMAVLDRKGEVSFVVRQDDRGMSHVGEAEAADGEGARTVTVPCDTLEAIVAAHAPGTAIDFLKIDVEGSEAAIIGATDWRRLRPTLLVVEATLPWSSTLCNEEWEPVLLAQGYLRAYFDGINCFYLREEDAGLLRHFALPVNTLDGFAVHDQAAVEAMARERQAAAETLSAARAETEALRRSLADALAEEQAARAAERAVLADREAELADSRAALVESEAALGEATAMLADAEAGLAESRATQAKAEAAWLGAVSVLEDKEAALAGREAALAETRAALAGREAELDAMRAEIAWLREGRDGAARRETALLEERAWLQGVCDERQGQIEALAARWAALATELRWEGGPRALRLVLPAARLLRRVRGARPAPIVSSPIAPIALAGEARARIGNAPGDVADAADARSVAAPASPDATVTLPPRRSPARAATLPVYRLVRPFVRPLAWRGRSFLMRDLPEMAQRLDALRQAQAELAERQGEELRLRTEAVERQMEVLRREHAEAAERQREATEYLRSSLLEEIRTPPPPPPPPPLPADDAALRQAQALAEARAQAATAEMERLARSMETALLTLALEHGALEHGALEHGAPEHGTPEHGAPEHG